MHDTNKLAPIFKIFVPLFSIVYIFYSLVVLVVQLFSIIFFYIYFLYVFFLIDSVSLFTVQKLSHLFGIISEFRLSAIFDDAQFLEL